MNYASIIGTFFYPQVKKRAFPNFFEIKNEQKSSL
jgi:hypothetical protein